MMNSPPSTCNSTPKMMITFSIISFLLSYTNSFLIPCCSLCTKKTSLFLLHHDGGELQEPLVNRRNMLSKSLIHTTITLLPIITSNPQLSNAEESPITGTSATSIRITSYPSLEYLEPIYELKLSIDSLQRNIQNSDNTATSFPYIYKRLAKMFANGIFSEKNYYLGLAVTYNNQIVYDKNELKTFVNLDKEERFNLINDTFNRLESLKNRLKIVLDGSSQSDISTNIRKKDILEDVEDAQRFMTRWFELIPKEDVNDVDNLYKMVRKADVNRDGKLDANELLTLPEKERDVWIKRIALVGD